MGRAVRAVEGGAVGESCGCEGEVYGRMCIYEGGGVSGGTEATFSYPWNHAREKQRREEEWRVGPDCPARPSVEHASQRSQQRGRGRKKAERVALARNSFHRPRTASAAQELGEVREGADLGAGLCVCVCSGGMRLPRVC